MILQYGLRRGLIYAGVMAATIAPLAARASWSAPMVGGPGTSAYCGTALVRHGRLRRFDEYCQTVERELRRNGPFEAALAKAHRAYASIYFTALANGQVVAAVFLRGSGNRQIDLGLMAALDQVRLPVVAGRSETFVLPIALRARDQRGFVAYRIQLVPYE